MPSKILEGNFGSASYTVVLPIIIDWRVSRQYGTAKKLFRVHCAVWKIHKGLYLVITWLFGYFTKLN